MRDNVAHLVTAKGMPEEKVREMEGQIQAMAQEIDRAYVTDRPMASTRGVHRVMQAIGEAQGIDAATDFFLELECGYFTATSNPFDVEAVVARAVDAGLPETAARAAQCRGRRMTRRSRPTGGQAAQMGARGVPFFLFNDKYTASWSTAAGRLPSGPAADRRRGSGRTGAVMSDRPGRGASEGDTGALSASEHLTGERDGSDTTDAPDSAEPQATTPLASLTSLSRRRRRGRCVLRG